MNKLTNIDIVNKLLEIRQLSNVCDRTMALKHFEKEYKKSSFYHYTHKKLVLLYYEVSIEHLLTLASLLENAQTFINNLDLAHFQELMDQVNAQTAATITEGLTSLSDSGLQDLIKTFKKA